MPLRRRVAALVLALALCVPAAAAAQTATVPDDGAGVSDTPPVQLGTGSPERAQELPDTGSDPRLLLLAGIALMLVGVGLRLRTADADDY